MEEFFHYAIIKKSSGEILDISVWDGKTPWTPPMDCIAVKCPKWVNSAHHYDAESGAFTNEYWILSQELSQPEGA